MTHTLTNNRETVSFEVDDIDANDRNFGFVWIHRCPVGSWAGNYSPNKYMVRDARRMYGELLKAGYTKA